jgi:THO complex subunit 1
MALQIGQTLEALSKSAPLHDSHDLNLLPTDESDCADLIAVCAKHDHAAVETAFRERLYDLTASSQAIEDIAPQIWQLLDAATILSDLSRCEAGLALWLVEELLDSQTIEGCKHVFDFLESRRERLVSKNFGNKNLIMLRMCNELLRRLSRAEDTVFCGRVFIWLFQSFPLGDKSSVNLRGEFHTENTTMFDSQARKSEDAVKPMELDVPDVTDKAQSRPHTPLSSAPDGPAAQRSFKSTATLPKPTDQTSEAPDLDALYPIFWSLQSFFSSPTRLFDRLELASFKMSLAATLSVFQKMPNTSSSSSTRASRGTKRKLSDADSPIPVSNTFNPKYLTNRDLFDLEIHDLSFRRNILVQALIILDFLLSLTPSAKAKLTALTNKSVLYTYTLHDEDAKWATSTRASIATYLQQQGNGNEGKFYYRMVDTVLSRDKNWVRWKAENCAPISLSPVNVATHVEAQNSLKRVCRVQPLPTPAGAENLAFLARSEPMEALKDPENRPRPPSIEELYKGIQNDELDAEMGTPDEIATANEAKESKIWRALRAGNRFKLSEDIRNGTNLKALIGEGEGENAVPKEVEVV